MKFFIRKGNDGKNKYRKGRIIACAIIFILIFAGIFHRILCFIHRDYRPEGRKDYLETVRGMKDIHKKNVVVILLDDMGYGDLSCTGATTISTPNIDKLAEGGMLFTNYYAPSPVCSASRAGLLTGRYPIRTLTVGAYMDTETVKGHLASLYECVKGTYPYWNTGLPTDEVLLPEVLGEAGYKTGMVGKWHLGVKQDERPNNRGFDYFRGALYSDDMKPYRVYENNEVIHNEPFDQSVLTKELTEASQQFITNNKDDPFFLYYASPFPHWPASASEEWIGTSEAGIYGDCMQEIDWSVGEIMKTLEENNLTEDTIVLFTSDNGPWYDGSTGGQRGRKATNYNGGDRVPLIAYMPGTIPQGEVRDGLIDGVDIFPTIMSMCNIDLPKDRVIDGMDMWPYLCGNSESPRTKLFINTYKSNFAVINDNFKYFERSGSENASYWMLQQGPFLYNLEKDSEEAYDVSMHYPEVTENMALEIEKFKQRIKDNIRGWKE